MNFADLYRYSNGLSTQYTPLRLLAQHVAAHHASIGEVEFFACDLSQKISRGHLKHIEDRSSPYGDPFDVASIRFDQGLNRCWRRFVCCKELMHVFDDSEERADTPEKVFILLDELQTNPLSDDTSAMFDSEGNAIWMAILVLCPERLRNKYLETFKGEPEQIERIAQELLIPKLYIRAIMGEHYQRALEILTGEPIAPAV